MSTIHKVTGKTWRMHALANWFDSSTVARVSNVWCQTQKYAKIYEPHTINALRINKHIKTYAQTLELN